MNPLVILWLAINALTIAVKLLILTHTWKRVIPALRRRRVYDLPQVHDVIRNYLTRDFHRLFRCTLYMAAGLVSLLAPPEGGHPRAQLIGYVVAGALILGIASELVDSIQDFVYRRSWLIIE